MEKINKLPKDLGYWHMLHILEWIMQNPDGTEKDYYSENNWDYYMNYHLSEQGYQFWKTIAYNRNYKYSYNQYK